MLEVETKYAVPDGFVLPALPGADAPESVELAAVYYDTADLRLARGLLTLRRRSGGKDAGWHVKLPATGGRREVSAPLGRGRAVPASLSSLVLARSRGAELVPVAELRTTRTVHLVRDAAGQPVVEVVDDTVRATRAPVGGRSSAYATWREVEAELLPGAAEDELAAVDAVLRAAGAAPASWPSKLQRALGDVPGPEVPAPAARVRRKDPARDAVAAHLREQVTALLSADPRVRTDEPEGLLALRDAGRRLRSALGVFAPLLEPAAVDGLDAELRSLVEALDAVVDHDALRARLADRLDALPPQVPVGPVAAEVDRPLPVPAQDGLRATLSGQRYVALLDRLVALAADPPTTGAAGGCCRDVLRPLVAQACRDLEERLDAALGQEPGAAQDAALRAAGPAAEQARHAAEAVTRVFRRPAAGLAAQAGAVQDALAEHRLAVLAQGRLLDLATASRAGFALGLLHASEQAAAAAARERVGQAWHEARRGRHRRWLTA